jgi:hypothetical protein
MNLYIETEDGVTKNHPAYEDNLIQAFGAVPAHWEPFIRVAAPPVGTFEVYEGASYALVDGVWTDVHNVRPMTAEEKAARIEQARANLRPNWTLNEATLQAIQPPRPTVKGAYPYKFDRETNQWLESDVPPFPSWVPSEDGLRYVAPTPKPEGQYRWDEATLSWVAFNV